MKQFRTAGELLENPLTSKLDADFPASSHIGGSSDASCPALSDKKMTCPEQLHLAMKGFRAGF